MRPVKSKQYELALEVQHSVTRTANESEDVGGGVPRAMDLGRNSEMLNAKVLH